ncbi:hypothetical protein L873DRAFT_1823860 [Choiromyces venosus 120613-1]|uniref:Uncharacterized protein n=1 Tax=Choiromyces venosus 120613-1 TaxID=1336337 RepID=A0A3N4ISV0_9PEZI|nr:hypothetical protein L873DRAFT_1823860 [Choiromyces venosus 120613-1]
MVSEATQIRNMLAFNQDAQITQMFHHFMNEQLELRLEFAQIQDEFIQIQDQFGQIRDQVGQIQDQVVRIRDRMGWIRYQFVQIQDLFVQIQDQFVQIQDQVKQIQDQVRELQNQQQRLPRMFYNTNASHLEPLRYPAGIPINNLTATRCELETFTGPQLQVTAQVLELPVLRELFDSLSTT